MTELVVPVYNGYEALERCLESLDRHTPGGHVVRLVDDASTDPRVLPLLRGFARRRAGTVLIENAANLGFVGAVNRAIAQASGDVVILNADTQVTPGWIEGLERCRASAPAVGIVCPLSNNATLLTVPALQALFDSDGAEAIAACVRRAGRPTYPRIPTAVGFCMLVTRALLDAAGPLDPAYGRGYGEENDLSMRALDLGFEIACADDVYVHHAGGASFGDIPGLDEARKRNRLRLERRWPAYAPGVSSWMRTNPLRPTLERINAQCERERLAGRPRVLYVMHAFDSHGGVEQHTRAMIDVLRHEVAFNVVVPRGFDGGWADLAQERPSSHLRISRFNRELFTPGIHVLEFRASARDPTVEGTFERFLAGGYDVVHFHSPVSWNSMALPRLARESGARVVLSAHDMGWMCADYNMVGLNARPCGRAVARGKDAGCVDCLRARSFSVGGAAVGGIGDFIEERFAAAADAVGQADAIVCPSRFMADRMAAAFGSQATGAIRVIPHGIQALGRIYRAAERPVLTVACVGRFSPQKGGHHFIEAARRLEGERIIFEAWGAVDERLREPARAAGVVLHGEYAIADLPRHLRAIDLVVIPTPLEESFCLTLAEAQALGIPVAAARIGAIPERIRDGENGFLFEPGSVDSLARLLVTLRDDRARLARVAACLEGERPKTVEENAAEYLALYRELAAMPPRTRREAAPPDPGPFFGSGRSRLRTPLGDDSYDRWLATEAPAAIGDGEPFARIVELPQGDAQALDLKALNGAIMACDAEWVVIVQAGDRRSPDALEALGRAARAHADAVLLYADEDAMSLRGERYDPLVKPAFSPELLRHRPYVAGLCALHRERVLAMGGLHAPGWLGVVELALRLAAEETPSLVARVPGILVHRLDSNLEFLERPAFRRAMNEVVAESLKLGGAPSLRLAASGGTPAMWSYPAAGEAPVTVFLRCDGAAAEAAACLDALLPAAGRRIGEVIADIPLEQAGALIEVLRRHGASGVVRAVRSRGGQALGEALRGAGHDGIAVIDARCRGFAPGLVERLEQGMASRFVAGIAPDLTGAAGERIPGAWVLGAGAWSVAGPAPAAAGNDALSSLYAEPREVSCVSPYLSYWRRPAVTAPGITDDLAHAGRFDTVHLALELAERGFDVVSRPFAAARCAAATPVPPRDLRVDDEVPGDVAWMRARWGTRLEDDPRFPPLLAASSTRVRLAPRFGPSRDGVVRVCAFPFDRWGSGELRVRQPCSALERAGWAEVAMMEGHESGLAPNALEWRRLGANVLLAHNFFHDYQLAALREYARDGRALRLLGMDDLLTQLPPGNPYAATIYPDIARRIALAKSLCDRLVVSTDELAQAYGEGIDVRVIPNALSREAWAGLENRPRGGERPRVGWAGAPQHLDDLALIECAVRETHREVDWVFLGMCPPALRRYAAEFHAMVPVARWPAKLASLGLDLALAPLADHPFNRAKSDLKVLEYGALGIPVVASNVGPYRRTPARLVENDDDAWIDAVRSLALDRAYAHDRGRKLRDWVWTHRMLSEMLATWRGALDR